MVDKVSTQSKVIGIKKNPCPVIIHEIIIFYTTPKKENA